MEKNMERRMEAGAIKGASYIGIQGCLAESPDMRGTFLRVPEMRIIIF